MAIGNHFNVYLCLVLLNRCVIGYTKSIDTNECEDINECDTGEANCDSTNQACLNTVGSFRCLDILVNERTSHCEDGFRYQARIDQCVGMFLTGPSTFVFIFPLSSFYFVCSLFIFLFFCLFFSHKQINDSILLDINECSEGTDDCNRKTQLCLNTRGSYKCQEKIGDKCLLGLKYNSETKLCEGGYCLIYSQALSNA